MPAPEIKIEGDLRREVATNIKRLTDIGSYRVQRHRRGLPVRGQRTRTNARSRRGPKRAVAGKKKVALPAGTVTDFTGLKDFTSYTITDESGKVVSDYQTPFCGNSWSSARTRPDAPATTPYPTQCGGEYRSHRSPA